MTTVEIILLVAGILCLIASFMIPDEKNERIKRRKVCKQTARTGTYTGRAG